MRLYIVRHGETAWNRERRYQGRIDVPLNETGLSQARCLADYFRSRSITRIFTSPLQRALTTARIIAGATGSPLEIAGELVEICHGVWEGLTVDEIASSYLEQWSVWNHCPSRVLVPESESLLEVAARLDLFLSRLDFGEESCVVTHGVVSQLLLVRLTGKDPDQLPTIPQANGCVNILEMNADPPLLEALNYTAHLLAHKMPLNSLFI